MERIGIIGGTGLYLFEGVEDVVETVVDTPFGPTSDAIVMGRVAGVDLAFLPRHGRGHRLLPTEVPYRANIWAMKQLGVHRIISASAVGSMKEDITLARPVLVDQFIDRTHGRASTFFGNGLVAHVSMADPTCGSLRRILADAAREAGIDVREGGTYVCMEGPQFSSRAESFQYRALGVDVIGMTNATEAKLAREAEICYATIALPTDYDCWHETHEAVSVETVIATLTEGTRRARAIIQAALPHIASAAPCSCGEALKFALLTDPALVPADVRQRLAPITGRYLK
jgi:5'-methylthioadenosine phosphorylase